jgi:hypothetical protein
MAVVNTMDFIAPQSHFKKYLGYSPRFMNAGLFELKSNIRTMLSALSKT